MNREMVKGVAIGLGVALVTPVVFPAVARAAKPAARAVIRAGVVAFERSRETLAELGEYAEDMVAEVRTGEGGGAMPIPPRDESQAQGGHA